MKKLVILITAIVIFTLGAGNVFGCSCVLAATPLKTQVKDAFKSSTAVFSAEVISVKEIDANTFAVTLKAGSYWKGITSSEITLSTPAYSAMCGYSFEVGKAYLIYANGQSNNLNVYNCSRTAPSDSNRDIAILKRVKKPKSFPK